MLGNVQREVSKMKYFEPKGKGAIGTRERDTNRQRDHVKIGTKKWALIASCLGLFSLRGSGKHKEPTVQ